MATLAAALILAVWFTVLTVTALGQGSALSDVPHPFAGEKPPPIAPGRHEKRSFRK